MGITLNYLKKSSWQQTDSIGRPDFCSSMTHFAASVKIRGATFDLVIVPETKSDVKKKNALGR